MTDVSAGFRPPCWCPSRWAPAWRLHINLYKFGKNVSPHIFRKKNCCDLNLGESLCISTFFLFPDSRLNRLNGFYFLFWSILNGVTLKTSNLITKSFQSPIDGNRWFLNTFGWLSIGHRLADTNRCQLTNIYRLVSIDQLLFRSVIFIDRLRPERWRTMWRMSM